MTQHLVPQRCQFPFHTRETGCAIATPATFRYSVTFGTSRVSSRHAVLVRIGLEIPTANMVMVTDFSLAQP